MTVLFVDDEQLILRGIERMLGMFEVDWDCEFATSGKEALEMIGADESIDTVVTDMRMPGMVGRNCWGLLVNPTPILFESYCLAKRIRKRFSGPFNRCISTFQNLVKPKS